MSEHYKHALKGLLRLLYGGCRHEEEAICCCQLKMSSWANYQMERNTLAFPYIYINICTYQKHKICFEPTGQIAASKRITSRLRSYIAHVSYYYSRLIGSSILAISVHGWVVMSLLSLIHGALCLKLITFAHIIY